MKIDFIKINGFGKLKDKYMNFKDGINIIYGENESGKSTIIEFITSMLYGISKNKNGKKISNFDKYSPWDNSEFSGKIGYTLESQGNYEVFYDFNKKNPIIYNSLGEDISKEFLVSKAKELNFLEEQVGIDENLFSNTSLIKQQNVKIDKFDTNSIIQKISNMVSTGDDNISYKKSMDKLSKMQTENVGTDKTKNRPLNQVNGKIKELVDEKKDLEIFKDNVVENFKELEKINNNLNDLENEKKFIKSLKKCADEVKLRENEIEFEKNSEKEYLHKIEEVQEKINQSNAKKDTSYNAISSIYYILLAILLIAFVAMIIFIKNKFFSLIPVVFIISDVIGIIKNKRNKKNNDEEIEKELQKEYKNAISEYNEKVIKREEKEKSFQLINQSEINNIIQEYKNIINKEFLDDKLNMDSIQLENVLEELENDIKDISIQTHVLNTERENIDSKLERLTLVEEELDNQNALKSELDSLNCSYNIAKECLEEAYNQIKNNLSPKFEKNLCEISDKITNGKYTNIMVNSENGLFIEVENGSYMPIDRLSDGTIDEMYLALRLSILEEISKENLPIIFDETFAYIDDVRLENILKYLQDNNYNNQMLIFSCSRREEEILKKLKIDYNLIKL